MAASPRAFVLRHTRLRPVPGLEEVRLHLADEVLRALACRPGRDARSGRGPPLLGVRVGGRARDRPIPARAPRGGREPACLRPGLGLRPLRDRGDACGRGGDVTGADIDAFAAAAIDLNARANGRRVTVVHRDVLDEEPPDVDVILAGDCWYDASLAERVLPWLHRALDRGIDCPGRRPRPPLPAHRRTGRARLVRGPHDDRARGSRAQAGPGLCPSAGVGDPRVVDHDHAEVAVAFPVECRSRLRPAGVDSREPTRGEHDGSRDYGATPLRPDQRG